MEPLADLIDADVSVVTVILSTAATTELKHSKSAEQIEFQRSTVSTGAVH